ncbi:TPA: hypothetical protein ACVNTL_000228 [Legionella pneumophila]|uniref:Uncharacterized protein n=1 Tax=Legionella pneumophila TaxID=446 RepID=A0A378K6G9_LEGPN|nr:hypothetical protein [Legionella pneumophila]MCZ4682027.1 hypothetical protein [Legionella pneumophila]MCZ4689350.1 hypothetical protein [Legionella pneumophila]MCZ4708093.1 hypothetical protein [Legionella pneumophila]MCZ4717301.1 hypothetical protein [Legionella pneumophila]MCZ4738605.1 hypothetical protein [Legionella pneumophila]
MKNFKYLTDKKFGKSRYVKEGPCYRTIICAAFLEYHILNKCEQTLIAKIQELIQCFHETKEFSLFWGTEHKEILLEMYPVLMKEQWGFLVVDHTGGCFPLVIYPYTNKYFDDTPNAARCAGLLRTIENIEKEKDRLVNLIVKYEDIYDGQTDLTYDDFQDELHSFIYSTRKGQNK